jgi:hypothetical protein
VLVPPLELLAVVVAAAAAAWHLLAPLLLYYWPCSFQATAVGGLVNTPAIEVSSRS